MSTPAGDCWSGGQSCFHGVTDPIVDRAEKYPDVSEESGYIPVLIDGSAMIVFIGWDIGCT